MYIFLTYVYIFLSERQQESRLHQHLESKALLHAVRKGNAERTQEEVRRHLPTRLSCCLETFFVNRVKKADWKMRQEENMGNWTSEWESRALLHELCAAPGILIVVPSDMVCECTELGNRISTSNSIEVVQFRKGPQNSHIWILCSYFQGELIQIYPILSIYRNYRLVCWPLQ